MSSLSGVKARESIDGKTGQSWEQGAADGAIVLLQQIFVE
jgi:hypothetical protein